MARRRKAAPETAETNQTFSGMDLPEIAPDPYALPSQEPEQKLDKDALLLQAIENLGRMTERLDRIEQDRIQQFSAPPPAAPAATKAPALDMTGMPDPVTDTEAFQKTLAERITGLVAAERAAATQGSQVAQSQSAYADALWEDFSSQYDTYAAEGEDRIAFATNKVMEDLQRKGVDTQRYITYNRGSFFKDIAKTYDDVFGKPEADDEPAARRTGDDNSDNRTGGMFGALGTSGSLSSKANPPKTDFISEIHSVQRKEGF